MSGRRVVCWKIAATSAGGQQHIGVSGPLAGRILSGQVYADGDALSLATNRMRVIEPEFAFRFACDLPPRAAPYAADEVLDAAAALHLALELPDSRFVAFARAGEAQLIADNACADRFILGAPSPADWRAIDLSRHAVRATVTGAAGVRLARDGDGSAVLGDPRLALTWLVNELSSRGIAITAGQFVSTGTCMSPLAVEPGDRVDADYGVLGRIGVALSVGSPSS